MLADLDYPDVYRRLEAERKDGICRIKMANHHREGEVSRIYGRDISRRNESARRNLRLPPREPDAPIRMALKHCIPKGEETGEKVGGPLRGALPRHGR